MSTPPPAPSPVRLSALGPWCAAVFPLAFYTAGAASEVGFGDEGAHVAAAIELMPIAAPGTPLAALAASFTTLLPVGPLSFRVALASAMCAAAVLGLFAHAAELTFRALFPERARLAPWWALAAALGVAQTPMFAAQAMRAQPFTAQYVVALAIIVALLRYESAEPHGDRRMLYAASFLQGLAFANHHALGLLLLGAAAPTLGRLFAGRGFMGVMGHAAAALVGFTAYAFVPIRLAYGPESLAERSLPARTLAFLHYVPFAEADAGTAVGALRGLRTGLGELRMLPLALAALALVATLRFAPRAVPRRVLFVWLLVGALPALGLVIALRPLGEADAFGVLVPSAMALFVLGLAGAWLFIGKVGSSVSSLAALLGVAVLGFQVTRAAALHGRARSAAALDHFADLARRDLPRGAWLMTDSHETFYHLLGGRSEEQLPPELVAIPAFSGGPPGRLAALRPLEPSFDGAVQAYAAGGARARAVLDDASARRPLFIDGTRLEDPALCPGLVPAGPYARLARAGLDARALSAELVAFDTLARAHCAELAPHLLRAALAHARCALVRGDGLAARAWLASVLGPEAAARMLAVMVKEPAAPTSDALEGLLEAERAP